MVLQSTRAKPGGLVKSGWSGEQKQNGLCVAEDTLFQIYQLAIKKKVTQQFVLCIKLLEKPHPRGTALYPLNRAKSSAEQRNILFLFTYVLLST